MLGTPASRIMIIIPDWYFKLDFLELLEGWAFRRLLRLHIVELLMALLQTVQRLADLAQARAPDQL